MTISSIDNHETTSKTESGFKRIKVALLKRWQSYLEARQANKHTAYYQHHQAEKLERARRDVERLWKHGL